MNWPGKLNSSNASFPASFWSFRESSALIRFSRGRKLKRFDLVVVGAGMAGLYALYKARKQGLSVVAIEAGDGVGGAWFWNRYPGCRCDVASIEYSYSFSDDLQQEWDWSERMAGQPEIERYLNHVADRFDLRKEIRFNQSVTDAAYDKQNGLWAIQTDSGSRFESQFLVMATGSLSVPNFPEIKNADSFAGETYHTALWPENSVDLTGKRVGVLGSGSSGVQLIQTVAASTASLTAFQRSPAYTFPARNRPLTKEQMNTVKANYTEIRARQQASFDGLSNFRIPTSNTRKSTRPSRKLLDLTWEERRRELKEFGPSALLSYVDLYFSEEADQVARELYREYLFDTVKDKRKAAALMPDSTPVRCKRQILDTNYYETFNLDHVDIVRLGDEPIVEMTTAGLVTTKSRYDLDVLIYATGFDAVTGPLTKINIRNAEGQSIREVWEEDGIGSYLGLQIAGFPNLFTVTGLGSPSVLSNLAYSIEYHVNWITSCIAYLKEQGLKSIEAKHEEQEKWGRTVNEAAKGRMYVAPSCNSWYLGSNIPGKERRFLIYVGGCKNYNEHCLEASENGYQRFEIKDQQNRSV